MKAVTAYPDLLRPLFFLAYMSLTKSKSLLLQLPLPRHPSLRAFPTPLPVPVSGPGG